MKNYIILLTIVLFSTLAKAQLETPALSPAATVKQTVGLTDIEVIYSRPSVKERIIFGDNGLVPFGELWRLGANAATTFGFSRDITLAGNELKKGDYTMLVRPNAFSWEFSVYRYESSDWNTYVAQTPVTTFTSSVQKNTEVQESFEISIQEITTQTASLEISWERIKIAIPITMATSDVVMANIEKTMKGPSSNDFFQAALFIHENKIDLPRALDYITKVTASDKALFFQVYREALILRDLDKIEQALQAAKRSLTLSQNAGNSDFVRLNEQLIASLK